VSSEMLEGEDRLTLEVFMTDEDVARFRAASPDVSVQEA